MIVSARHTDADGTRVAIETADGMIWHTPILPADTGLRAALAEWVAAGGVIAPHVPAPPSPPTIPARVTRRQARLALHQAGLLGQVEALMASPETPATIRITYDDATEWWRDDPIIQAMALALNLPPEQLDALFVAAAAL